MRRQRGLLGLTGVAALVGLGMISKPTVAAVTTEKSASILVFPKVIANGARDTIIQITNTSNTMRHAHCFYVNGALGSTVDGQPCSILSPSCQPLCTEIDFDIWLTKQQPTHWVVSRGRQIFPNDETCQGPVAGSIRPCDPATSGGPGVGIGQADCCDAGFDPGRVPPVVPDFTGELKCIEVDADGAPVPGDSLKGEATLVDPITGDVSKYNAIGLKGFNQNDRNNVLCLGGGSNPDLGCPEGAEYEACPLTWLIDHPANGAPDLVVGEAFCTGADTCGSSIDTTLTVVPCTENFETQHPVPVTLQFNITNEFEVSFSASTTISCWSSLSLPEINPIFAAGNLGGQIVQTKMRSTAGVQRGVMAVIEETHTANRTAGGASTTLSATAAQNVHTSFQNQAGPDVLTIPGDQITPPEQP